mmetsp:Transcript_7017/g.15432  ORF Transcript_7017/g.15432 Transcript_7017/m.15432 type:complete len:231 (-) Transcript_7017:6-698(-)
MPRLTPPEQRLDVVLIDVEDLATVVDGGVVVPDLELAGRHVEVHWQLDGVRLVLVEALKLHHEVLIHIRQGQCVLAERLLVPAGCKELIALQPPPLSTLQTLLKQQTHALVHVVIRRVSGRLPVHHLHIVHQAGVGGNCREAEAASLPIAVLGILYIYDRLLPPLHAGNCQVEAHLLAHSVPARNQLYWLLGVRLGLRVHDDFPISQATNIMHEASRVPRWGFALSFLQD